MTTRENSYTMPLLFGPCRKQGHCRMSAIAVVTAPAGIEMRSTHFNTRWCGSTQVGGKKY